MGFSFCVFCARSGNEKASARSAAKIFIGFEPPRSHSQVRVASAYISVSAFLMKCFFLSINSDFDSVVRQDETVKGNRRARSKVSIPRDNVFPVKKQFQEGVSGCMCFYAARLLPVL
jgi:hypothetical protein